MCCVPNCNDVLSNLPFLLVGALGLDAVSAPLLRNNHRGSGAAPPALGAAFFSGTPAEVQREATSWAVFFSGVALTAFGSAYYHWRPSNRTLVWDRLPMTIAFMGLFDALLVEYAGPAAGFGAGRPPPPLAALLALLAAGAASVAFWRFTDDLRPYGKHTGPRHRKHRRPPSAL
jgi:hypothetical protein